MVEGFVPLARSLRARAADAGERASPASGARGGPPAAPSPERTPQPNAHPQTRPPDSDLALLAHMRLAAREAFERGTARLLAGLARDVLGRELLLAPADVDALVARALGAFSERGPVAIDVSPADADAVAQRVGLPLRVDPALGPGDIVVRVRDGSFESPLAFRLAGVLADAAAGA